MLLFPNGLPGKLTDDAGPKATPGLQGCPHLSGGVGAPFHCIQRANTVAPAVLVSRANQSLAWSPTSEKRAGHQKQHATCYHAFLWKFQPVDGKCQRVRLWLSTETFTKPGV